MSKYRTGVKCPDYKAMLGHYARVSIERDAMRAALEDMKQDREGDRAQDRVILEILGRELFSDRTRLLGSIPVNEMHNLVVQKIRELKKVEF